MTTVWVTVVGLAVSTAAIRAAGPVLLGGRDLSPRLLSVITMLAPALLAALVVTQTLGGPQVGIEVDARLAGVATAGAAVAARRSALVAVLLAASVTALVRAMS